MRTRPNSVFVPFELKGNLWVMCGDLPRFVEPKDVIRYLSQNRDLASRRLDWREEFDAGAIDEYMAGVGELKLRVH